MPNRTVLLVDDDPFMRDLGRIHLEAAGFAAETCADPIEALNAARQRSFDLIIVDIAMPQMSGLEFLAAVRMRDRHVNTPVLILSAWTSDEAKGEALRLGADWLDKPTPAARLVERANQLVEHDDIVRGGQWVQSSAS